MNVFLKRSLLVLWCLAAVVCAVELVFEFAILLKGDNLPLSLEQYMLLMIPVFTTSWLIAASGSRRRRAREFASLSPMLTAVMRDFVPLGIDCATSEEKREQHAAARDGIFFYAAEPLPDAAVDSAVQALAPLTQWLKTYRETPGNGDGETFFRLRRVRKSDVWVVKWSVNDGSVCWKYTYSPEGNTPALRRALFFPPRQLAPQWFI